jgi:PhnB protein
MRVIPYLTYNGECEEALNLYKEVFGGEITSVMRFEEMPEDPDMPVTDAWKKKIMHAELKFGNDLFLYFSDAWEGSTAEFGDAVTVHLDVDSEEELRKYFTGLAEDGEITMPAEKTFWGAVYGSVIDKYGIRWGFNYSIPE